MSPEPSASISLRASSSLLHRPSSACRASALSCKRQLSEPVRVRRANHVRIQERSTRAPHTRCASAPRLPRLVQEHQREWDPAHRTSLLVHSAPAPANKLRNSRAARPAWWCCLHTTPPRSSQKGASQPLRCGAEKMVPTGRSAVVRPDADSSSYYQVKKSLCHEGVNNN